MLQIFFDHLLGHLPHRRTKVASRPKMPPLLPQRRKRLEPRAGRPPLAPPHDLARRHFRRYRDQDVDVSLADHTLDDPTLEGFAGRLTRSRTRCPTSPVSTLYRYFVTQTKVLFTLVNRVASVPIVHLASGCMLNRPP